MTEIATQLSNVEREIADQIVGPMLSESCHDPSQAQALVALFVRAGGSVERFAESSGTLARWRMMFDTLTVYGVDEHAVVEFATTGDLDTMREQVEAFERTHAEIGIAGGRLSRDHARQIVDLYCRAGGDIRALTRLPFGSMMPWPTITAAFRAVGVETDDLTGVELPSALSTVSTRLAEVGR